MILLIRSHFNTALRFISATLSVVCITAYAQTEKISYAEDSCGAILNSQSTEMTSSPSNRDVWFIPNQNTSATSVYDKQTLMITPTNESTLWSLGSHFLTKFPATWNISHEVNQYFAIVRSKPIKTKPYRSSLGLLVQTIGMAKIIANHHTTHPSKMTTETVMLEVRDARQEITAQDRLVPLRCLAMYTKEEPLVVANAETERLSVVGSAHILAFLDESYMGQNGSIAIMDKGIASGVRPHQVWALMDQLSSDPSSAQLFGVAKVIQSYEQVSLVQLSNLVHEARLQTTLQHYTHE